MPRNLIRLLVAISLLSLSGGALAKGKDKGKGGGGGGNDDDNQRKEWIKKYDHNKDGRWRGGLFGHKDIKAFKKEHEGQYDKLVSWCEKASEKPNKFDVNFPKGENEKKFKCKKGKVDEPYLKAWAKAEKEKDEPEPERERMR